jgi:hypothetical protein
VTISQLIDKWLAVVAGDVRAPDDSEPAAPVKPVWRELLRSAVQTRALGRVLVTKGLVTQAEIDAAISIEADNLDAQLTQRFG